MKNTEDKLDEKLIEEYSNFIELLKNEKTNINI